MKLQDKYYEMPGSYSKQWFVGKTGSQWTVANYNPHHLNWIAGNAYASNSKTAISSSASDALIKFPSAVMALRCLAIAPGDDIDEIAGLSKKQCRNIFKQNGMRVEIEK